MESSPPGALCASRGKEALGGRTHPQPEVMTSFPGLQGQLGKKRLDISHLWIAKISREDYRFVGLTGSNVILPARTMSRLVLDQRTR